MGKLKRNNGIVIEVAHLRGSNEEYDRNYESIFGKREKVLCDECNLSSRQKIGEDFSCPHCDKTNNWNDGEYKIEE